MSLAARLRERIRLHGPLTFAEFMDAALYDAEDGFYARGAHVGARGAFATAPTRSAAFARAVAAEARAAYEALGRPREFVLVEAGPGDGTLAAALAHELADVVSRVVLVERADGMRRAQEQTLAHAPLPVAWAAAPEELRAGAGFVVANELLDDLAVHLLDGGDEILVDLDADGRFVEVRRPAPRGLLDLLGVEPREGRRYAVSPQAPRLLLRLAATLARGRLLVADYGGEGEEVHGGVEPVRTYVAGVRGGDPLQAPGRQNVTADVDFGALRRAARAAGLRELRYGPQEEWAPAVRLRGFKVLLLEWGT